VFLKSSRLVLRRSAAQELCDAGLVYVNGHTAKSSKEVKEGDELRIERRNRKTVVKIMKLPPGKQVSKHDAPSLYEMIEDEVTEDDFLIRGSA
jgi:ribosomal 50S subunit-recycling heat shock protein